MNSGVIEIHRVDLTAPFDAEGIGVLNASERLRADAFRFRADAERWITCRVALRRILSELVGVPPERVPIVLNAFGKPRMDAAGNAPGFNLSHCRDLALIAVRADGDVGIDIEHIDRGVDLLECESSFCHADEIASLPFGEARAAALLDLWTGKEALLKALGTGFSLPPESIRLHAKDGRRSDQGPARLDEITVMRLDGPWLAGHRAAVAADGTKFTLKHPSQA